MNHSSAVPTSLSSLARKQLHAGRCQASTGGEASTSGGGKTDLLIIGPGVLGSLVGKLWQERNASAEVIGQTNTTTNHERLRALGIYPRLKQDANDRLFPNVLFSAPPSGSKDYVVEVQGALQKWNRQGTFVFTSSSGVMKPKLGEELSENTELHALGSSERIDRLLKCEQLVLKAGGCVARFVGLYHARRGAHMVFLRQGTVERWGGHIVNLIHYEDAANLCLKGTPFKGEFFFGTDASPVTFQEMMDATTATGAYHGSCELVGAQEDDSGPRSSNEATRQKLKWAPKYKSFQAFMSAGAQDVFQDLP